jgi:hypothetical protein
MTSNKKDPERIALEPDFDAVPTAEEDESWFSATELAEASEVELGAARFLTGAYSKQELSADRSAPFVDLTRLPSWPGGPETGTGWGSVLGRELGGLQPGRRLLLDARTSGQGQTGLLGQLADGLALRSARVSAGQPITPVIVLAEDGREEWGRRSVARWTGHEQRLFRGSRSHPRVDPAFADAEQALDGELGVRDRFLRFVPQELLGLDVVTALVEHASQWHAELAGEHDVVWPVLVVDGLSRHASEPSADAVAQFVRSLSAAVRRSGWILLASDRQAQGRLDGWFDARIELSQAASEPPTVEARVQHNRLGPRGALIRYAWEPGTSRFVALD